MSATKCPKNDKSLPNTILEAPNTGPSKTDLVDQHLRLEYLVTLWYPQQSPKANRNVFY